MRAFKTISGFIEKYKHGLWIAAYMFFYLAGFAIVENAGHRHYHVIHSWIDDLIPFCEYFIIPYILWFAFMLAGILWFIFRCKDKREYYQLVSVLAIGMTLFLVVSCIYPNKQDLRPEVFVNSNFCTRLVQMIYASDTPTNVLPSIHVYNSLAIFYAVNSCRQLRDKKTVRFLTGLIAISIVLSTMFVKQHSVVDVSLGILLSISVQRFCEFVFQGETSGAERAYARSYVRRG